MPYDPVKLEAPTIIADQLQKGRSPKVTNLSSAIVDVTIETSVQGASMIVLAISDPHLQLLTSGFIQTDEDGLLEAIDIEFMSTPGNERWWRLAACDATNDLTAANLTLTFEDRIVSLLRDKSGPKAARPGETREQFLASCVHEVPSIKFICPTYQQEIKAGQLVGVGSSIATGAQALSGASSGLLTTGQLAKQLSPARLNPAKLPGIDPASRKPANRHLRKVGSVVSGTPGATSITL